MNSLLRKFVFGALVVASILAIESTRKPAEAVWLGCVWRAGVWICTRPVVLSACGLTALVIGPDVYQRLYPPPESCAAKANRCSEAAACQSSREHNPGVDVDVLTPWTSAFCHCMEGEGCDAMADRMSSGICSQLRPAQP